MMTAPAANRACPVRDCAICAHNERRAARAKMTKAQLLEDANAADNAYMEAAESSSMATHWMKVIEKHLKDAHGCTHEDYESESSGS